MAGGKTFEALNFVFCSYPSILLQCQYLVTSFCLGVLCCIEKGQLLLTVVYKSELHFIVIQFILQCASKTKIISTHNLGAAIKEYGAPGH